jgi:hypothetical protein
MKRHLLKQRYIVALASEPNDAGALQPLASFMTNPAGSAIVNATGAIDKPGPVVQVQLK